MCCYYLIFVFKLVVINIMVNVFCVCMYYLLEVVMEGRILVEFDKNRDM